MSLDRGVVVPKRNNKMGVVPFCLGPIRANPATETGRRVLRLAKVSWPARPLLRAGEIRLGRLR